MTVTVTVTVLVTKSALEAIIEAHLSNVQINPELSLDGALVSGLTIRQVNTPVQYRYSTGRD